MQPDEVIPPGNVPGVVQPSLTQLTAMVHVVEGRPTNCVALRIFSPVGQAFYLLTPDAARTIAKDLVKVSDEAASGLTIVQNGKLGP